MPVSLPVGAVVGVCRWVWERLTKRLYLPTYRKSHEIWMKRHRLGAHWHSCGDHLEYSTYLPNSTDPEPRIPRIALRAKGENIEHASLIFEAESRVARFQERIVVTNVGKKPVIYSMVNIPHQELVQADERGIRFSLDEYILFDIYIRLESGLEFRKKSSLRASLTHSWLINSEWENKWGQPWNLDVLKFAKGELAGYWRFVFGANGMRRYTPNGCTSRPFGSVIRKPIAGLMATDLLVSTQFWLAIWSGLWLLNEDWRLECRWKRNVKAEK